jgi:predicted permease
VSFWRKVLLQFPSRRRAEDRDIREELDALRDIADVDLGNLTLAAEDARAAQSWAWLDLFRQDVPYALRSLARQKGLTAVIVATLGLAIGATGTIYGFLDAVLLRPLPVRDPHALVIMKWRAKEYTLARSGMAWSTGGTTTTLRAGTVATNFPYAALEHFNASSDVLSHAFAYFTIARIGVTWQGQTDALRGQYVSGAYFDGIGLTVAAGRAIQPADDTPGTSGVAVVSERFSRTRFTSAQAAVGQAIRVNDKPFEVVGVAPADFFGAEAGAAIDVFLPMQAYTRLEPQMASRYTDPYFYWAEVMGRVRPGVSVDVAQTTLAPRFQRFMGSFATEPREREDLPVLAIEPGARGLDTLRRRYGAPIYVLFGMVALIWLIACANTASLLLSRGAARRKEIAVRLSIGAGRTRLIQQLLTESVVLASLAGVVGLLLSWWGIEALTRLLAIGRDNFTLHANLNWSVFAATAGLSLATGLLFGIVPALEATRLELIPALKEARPPQIARSRWSQPRHALLVAQVVFSFLLLVFAGLFGKTASRLHGIELGFDREQVLLFAIRPASIGYSGETLGQLYGQLRTALAALPGVTHVSASTSAPPQGGGTMGPAVIEGGRQQPAPGERGPMAVYSTVGPDFFTTMKMQVEGRDLSDHDTATMPAVAVVNRRMVATAGVTDPLGRVLILANGRFTIVGVVEDALTFDLKEERRPAVYTSYLQAPRLPGGLTFQVRTSVDPEQYLRPVRAAVHWIDPRLAVYDVRTLAAHIDQTISTELTLARLGTGLAGVALVIACIGLYGIVAFHVARRTKEIGIRVALGAASRGVVWLVVRDVLGLVTAGIALGVPVALTASQYVRTLLFEVEPTDPLVVGGSAVLLAVSGLIAALVPGRLAARIDPMVAVRQE